VAYFFGHPVELQVDENISNDTSQAVLGKSEPKKLSTDNNSRDF